MAHSAPLFTNQGIAATAMASPSAVQPLVFVGVGLLVAWRLYSRIRRLVGRQPYRPVRSWIQAVLFGVLLVSLLVGTWRHPLASLSELAGVALGLGLALWGLKLTVFEKTGAGCFYTPNLHLGIALSLVFTGRIVYKLVRGYSASAGFTEPPMNLVKSPLTLFIVGTLAGYYATYAIGLIRRRRQGVPPWTRDTPAAAPGA